MTIGNSCKQLEMMGSICRNDVRLFVRVGVPVKDATLRNDSGGSGHYGASRAGGKRAHKGVDVATTVGQEVFSPIDGSISKIGWANATHRYIEIEGTADTTDLNGNLYQGDVCKIRILYVKPSVAKGDPVSRAISIGTADDLHRNNQYPANVGQHIHVEVMVGSANMDPTLIVPTKGA